MPQPSSKNVKKISELSGHPEQPSLIPLQHPQHRPHPLVNGFAGIKSGIRSAEHIKANAHHSKLKLTRTKSSKKTHTQNNEKLTKIKPKIAC